MGGNVFREGDIYMVISVRDKSFEIKYGYYEDFERECQEPIPIFPDLAKCPVYTECGYKIVTQVQMPCEYFKLKSEQFSEEWCGSCKHFEDEHSMISVCTCQRNNINNEEKRFIK